MFACAITLLRLLIKHALCRTAVSKLLFGCDDAAILHNPETGPNTQKKLGNHAQRQHRRHQRYHSVAPEAAASTDRRFCAAESEEVLVENHSYGKVSTLQSAANTIFSGIDTDPEIQGRGVRSHDRRARGGAVQRRVRAAAGRVLPSSLRYVSRCETATAMRGRYCDDGMCTVRQMSLRTATRTSSATRSSSSSTRL